jgi:amino-acid N-acetyltransferase
MINSLTKDSAALSHIVDDGILVRKATMSDIRLLLELINAYAAEGTMLPRTEFEISENLRDFTVAFSSDRLIACGALHFYSPTSGEIRSLAVRKDSKHRGVGRKLVEALEAEARAYDLEEVFAFTYVTDFFSKLGFVAVERGLLPLKAWKDCSRCPKFQCCDEIAMMKVLTATSHRQPYTHIGGDTELLNSEGNSLILLPTVRKPASGL